jgi:hypothetical protein
MTQACCKQRNDAGCTQTVIAAQQKPHHTRLLSHTRSHQTTPKHIAQPAAPKRARPLCMCTLWTCVHCASVAHLKRAEANSRTCTMQHRVVQLPRSTAMQHCWADTNPRATMLIYTYIRIYHRPKIMPAMQACNQSPVIRHLRELDERGSIRCLRRLIESCSSSK